MGYPTREQTEAELGWLDSERVRLTAELAEAKAAKELAEAQRDELMDASGTLINKWIQTGEGMQTHPCQIFLPAVDEWWRHVCRVVYPKPTGGTNG